MIKIANELRVGSMLHSYAFVGSEDFDEPRIIRLDTQRIEEILQFENDPENYEPFSTFDGRDYRPIELTEESLEVILGLKKNGFKQYEINIEKFNNTLRKIVIALNQGYIYIREGNSITGMESVSDSLVCVWNRDLTPKYYIHQLQNLYLCLTGKELEHVRTNK